MAALPRPPTRQHLGLRLARNQWTNRQPANPPPARNSHALVYDQENERTILFGGGDAFVDFDDTWAYDYVGNTWTALVLVKHPVARACGSLAYDERANRIIRFGGVNYTETTIYGDTWLYNPTENRWTQQHQADAPTPHGWYDMAYRSGAARLKKARRVHSADFSNDGFSIFRQTRYNSAPLPMF